MQTNGAVRPIVRKKAALCLLRLMRKSPADAELLQPEVWSVKLVRTPSASCLSWAVLLPPLAVSSATTNASMLSRSQALLLLELRPMTLLWRKCCVPNVLIPVYVGHVAVRCSMLFQEIVIHCPSLSPAVLPPLTLTPTVL